MELLTLTELLLRCTFFYAFQLFEKVKRNQPGVETKVVAVCGDILEPNFGMSAEDQQRVCENTSIVFHSAATVKFDEELK